MENGRWRCPTVGLHDVGKVAQKLSVNRIGLGALHQGFGKVMRTLWIDHAHLKASRMERRGRRHPVSPGGFHDNEGDSRWLDALQLACKRAIGTVRLDNL